MTIHTGDATKGKAEIAVDGGLRRSTRILKPIALGAGIGLRRTALRCQDAAKQSFAYASGL